MITSREIAAGLYGAWRLAHFDRSGVGQFDNLAPAAIRSFYAALFTLPAYAVLAGFDFTAPAIDASAGRYVLVFAIAYVLDWAAFPLAMAWVAPMIGAGDRYLLYVGALNWSRVIQTAAFLPAALLAFLAPQTGLALVVLAVAALILAYQWFVAKAVLDIGGGRAAAVVAINAMLSAIIHLWALGLVSGAPPAA